MAVTVGQKITAALWNALEAMVTSKVATAVVPTVSGSGVTVNTTTGLISFSGSTVITVDTCFSASYKTYEIFLESQGTAANSIMVLRTSIPGDLGTGYDYTTDLNRNGTATSSTNPSQAAWSLSQGTNTIHQMKMTLTKPFDSVPSSAIFTYGVHANPAVSNANNVVATLFASQQASTSTPGFKITFSAAQSGTLRIVGIA